MSETTRHHIGISKVLEEDRRDLFHELPQELQDSWRPEGGIEDDQPEAGTKDYQYTVDLTPEWAERLAGASNAKYVVPVETVQAHDLGVDALEDVEVASFPDPQEWEYHRAAGLEDQGYDGEGVTQFNLDTGVSSHHIQNFYAGRLVWQLDFTGQGYEDRQGHGSMSSSIQVARKSYLFVCKVLGDDGSGSSDWIIGGIKAAYDYAESHPDIPVQVNASLGGGFAVFGPYVDIINLLLSLPNTNIVVSAGNDGQYGITSPANSRKGIASLAFGLDDYRADFSNYSEDGGCASIGYRALVIRADGSYGRANGTSFSAPWRSRLTACLATPKMGLGSIQQVDAAILANCRDTPEPTQEESAGAVDVAATIHKMGVERTPARIPQDELKRISINGYDRASNARKIEIQDVALTIGQKQEDFAVVRLLPPYWEGGA